jgi:hypothetical protein
MPSASQTANADALSRIPGGEPCSDFNLRVKLQDLPCGGCPYCTRAHTNWSGFDQDVDDVVPLANNHLASCPCGSSKFISQVRLLWSVLTVKCLPNK